MKNAKKFLAALLVSAMVFTLVACKANYEWTTDKLPKPSSLKGEVSDYDDGSFAANIECSEKYFLKYIDKCRNNGFNAEEYSTSEGSTYLYNADGSTLMLMYVNGTMCIDLMPPITLGNAEWPNIAAADQIPKPKSDLYGQAKGPYGDNTFCVYVGNTSHSDFNDYVKQCKEAGFNDIMNDEPVYFIADKGKYRLILSYDGLNVMRVSFSPK